MKLWKSGLKILFVVFLSLILAPLKSNSKEKVKTIVIFFSMNETTPAYQSILQGFNGVISEYVDQPCNVMVEYLDVERILDNDYIGTIVKMYNEKISSSDLDLIITVGPETFPLLKKYGLKLLETTPAIVIDLDKLNGRKKNQPAQNIFEINIKYDIGKTLKNAFELFPDNRNIYIISGNAAIDQYNMKIARQAADSFKERYSFNFITGITLDSILKVVEKLPEKSIVFVSSFRTDNRNIPYSTTIALSYIVNICKSPLFTFTDNFIKRGGIGGCIYSFTEVGKETGRVALEILSGKSPREITVDEDGFYRYIFDWHQIKKWNLQKSKAIPSGSQFINKDIDFYSKYRTIIIALLFFAIIQMLLILYLYRLNTRKKEIAKEKAEVDRLYRALLHEERLSKMAELTASISHELNQPLTSILYNAQAGVSFQNKGKLDSGMTSEILGNIIEDSKRAGGILSTIRSLLKLESRELQAVNMCALILETITIFRTEAIMHQITIKENLQDRPVFAFGDKIQLQQVLMNLLFNSLFALESIKAENRTIEIVQKTVMDFVIVSVQDSGPGIESSIIQKIFEPFVSTRKDGLGIGLSICKSIIEKHKGTIWAENVDGGGAKFYFSIPIMKNGQKG